MKKYSRFLICLIFFFILIVGIFIFYRHNKNIHTAKELPDDFLLANEYTNNENNLTIYVSYPTVKVYKLCGYVKNGYYFDRTDIYHFDILKYDQSNIILHNGEYIVSHGMYSRTEATDLSGIIIINSDGSITLFVDNDKTISDVILYNNIAIQLWK